MGGWWVHNLIQDGQVVVLVSWVFWVIFSICLHELAHGWAAIWQGDNTPRELGHMTMNPLVHMGGWSLLMFALTGIAWGMMPVDPSRFRWRRRGRIVVAGAGPAMNVLLALISLTLAALWLQYGPMNSDPMFANVEKFLLAGGWINLALAAFNMLPIPPLDGGSVLMGFSFWFYRLMQNPQAQSISLLLFLVVFMSGAGAILFEKSIQVSNWYVFKLLSLISGGP